MNLSARSVLFHNGFIHSAADPFATALFVEDGVIAWLGEELSSGSFKKRADLVVDLDGALLAPAFVDTHVHLLETALAGQCVDVSPDAGGTSAKTVIDLLSERLGATQVASHVLRIEATGYLDSEWAGPSLQLSDLDLAFPGVEVYVPRADLHSALCSSTLLKNAGIADSELVNGRVTGSVHTRVREYLREISGPQRLELYRRVLSHAASLGFAAVHENSAPGIDTREGLQALLEMTADASSGFPLVVGYRGELLQTIDELDELRRQVPLVSGAAGDLNIDGSFGSHTAALRAPYSDDDKTSGTLYLEAEHIATHLRLCSDAGLSAGFHVIGDAGLDRLLEGARLVAAEAGMLSKMRRSRHRLEHVEIADDDRVQELANLGFAVSLQPSFDATWGGVDGMYAKRLGQERALETNPVARFMRHGVPVGFGSDAPVTSLDPWGAVASSVFHNNPDSRISARAAFKAHTRGGWRLGGAQDPFTGEIRIGAAAHLAVWNADQLGVQAENQGRSSWSTDARAGSPLLPILDPTHIARGERPQCLATLRDGHFIYCHQMFENALQNRHEHA